MDTLVTTLLSVAISAMVSSIVGVMIKQAISRSFERKEELDAKRAKEQLELQRYRAEEERKARIEDYKAVAYEVMHPIEEKVDTIAKKVDKLENQMDGVSEASVLSLRVDMKTLKDRFKEQGFADTGDKAMWNELYDRYKLMGGNHFKEYVDQWKSEVKELPNEKN